MWPEDASDHMGELPLTFAGQDGGDLGQDRSRGASKVFVAHSLDLGETQGQRLDLAFVQGLRREGPVLSKAVSVATLALDTRARRA